MARSKLILSLLTIVCHSFTSSQFLWTSVAVSCTFVLSSPSVVGATDDDDECARWNCPCAAKTTTTTTTTTPSPTPFTIPSLTGFMIRKNVKRQNTEPRIIQSARQTRERTRQLRQRLIRERYRNNTEHVESLESCVQNRDQRCLGLHLNRQCRLEGLPHFQQIENAPRFSATATNLQYEAFVRNTRPLLSGLAVYVQQAREDEQRRVTDTTRCLANDTERIEDDGIYQILCDLQIGANYRDITWDVNVASGGMPSGCIFDTQAPIDNRNYMVFYLLEKLLHQIVGLTIRKRNGWVVSDLQQSPVYRQIAAGSDESDGNGGDDIGIVAQKYLQEPKSNYDEN